LSSYHRVARSKHLTSYCTVLKKENKQKIIKGAEDTRLGSVNNNLTGVTGHCYKKDAGNASIILLRQLPRVQYHFIVKLSASGI
jgi:hypothetical protein